MKELEANMRTIEMDGLTWGASQLVPVGFGIKKLQVNLVVEDEKVSVDDLQAKIEEDEDHVQSTDVVSTSFLFLIHCGMDDNLTFGFRRPRCKSCSFETHCAQLSPVHDGMPEMSLDMYADLHYSKSHRSVDEEYE